MKNKKLFKSCERLWKKIVKLRAGNKSELSGNNMGILDPHHISGKKTYALRFDIRNGILLTRAEHIFGIHNHDPDIAWYYHIRIRDYIKQREGENIFDILAAQKNHTGVNLQMIEIVLKANLKELQNEE